MRWVPRVVPMLVGIIVLDLMLVFGIEAVRILSSPVSGLDKPAFAHVIYALGKLAHLSPDGRVLLATLFGSVYLTTAVMLGLHLASRVPSLHYGGVSHDLLDAALILVVISTLIPAMPAILEGASEILLLQRLPLWLVGLAATMSMVERLPDMDETAPPILGERTLIRLATRRKRQDAPVTVSPPDRGSAATPRWNALRVDAGMKLQSESPNAPECYGPWFVPR